LIRYLLHPVSTAILALLAYGSWAAFSNIDFGLITALKAFGVQGLFAFTTTLGLSLLAARLYRSFGANYTAILFSFLLCFILIGTVPPVLHWLISTPNIFKSILPGLIWGSIYILGYLVFYHRAYER